MSRIHHLSIFLQYTIIWLGTIPGFLIPAAGQIPITHSPNAISQTDSLPTVNHTEQIKINEDIVKLIRFDFTQGNNTEQLLEAPMEKRWMKFKEDLSLTKSFTDTTKVKRIEGYVRAEPFTIWTQFGENPVYDVLPGADKKWEIQWTITPFKNYRDEYGHSLKPSPGKNYMRVVSSIGATAGFTLDLDKVLYENLSKKGRTIKHNRKHANAWKSYREYQPTAADSLKFPNFHSKKINLILPVNTLPLGTDTSLLECDSTKLKIITTSTDSLKISDEEQKRTIQQTDSITESYFERYIKNQKKKREKQKILRHDGMKNAYDIGKEIRLIKEKQN